MLNKKSGYTLIEILIVISIFAALFVLGYGGFREFTRREQVNTALLTLSSDIRLLQQQSFSGKKPFGCTGNLKGYSLRVASTTTYEIIANCTTDVQIKLVTLPTNLTINTPSPNPIFFKSVGDGTNIPVGSTTTLTITQGTTLTARSLYITSSGELREDTGLARADLTPSPTTFYATSTPIPTSTPTPSPSPTPAPWYVGQYYNNRTLSGNPALTRNDTNISFNWGTGSPGAPIGVDNFSVRWTRSINFSAGTYTFTTTTDDGVRLYVDGVLVIDRWVDQGPTTYQSIRTLTAGYHTIVMEYYENGGGAYAVFGYQQGAATPTPAPTTPPGFNFCVNEGSYCDFPGDGWRVVRYGVDGSYIESGFPGGVSCTNQVFGDPAPGQPKHCDWFNQ